VIRTIEIEKGAAIVVSPEKERLFVRPRVTGEHRIGKGDLVWLLPPRDEVQPAYLVRRAEGAVLEADDQRVTLVSPACLVEEHEPWPRADAMGNRYSLKIEHGDRLEEALAAFCWDTIIPCVGERMVAKDSADSDGYVLSSPETDRFAGTYPSCDHEFGIKGRIAFGDELDLAVVGRMIDLALRVMRENPEGTWGCPCAVQPNGDREYFWLRGTMDASQLAQMFRLSGNAEVLEAAWLYYAATKDREWLAARIGDLEAATKQIAQYTDANGWLDGGAFYVDAVIKDGPSSETSALTANALRLLAELETVLGRHEQAQRFAELSERMASRLCRPFPEGLWDAANRRFIDWIDKGGKPHDHLQLLGNILPSLFGFADQAQRLAVSGLVREEFAEYQRFPTFDAARIADYDDSEISINGPFDCCAMARIWSWDAAYWHAAGRGDVLRDQLLTVAQYGKANGWRMAERYNMNHVYYADSPGWHGSAYYYEYPCVFAWVLVHEYLGIRPALDVDLEIAPRILGDGEVRFDAYAVSYRIVGGFLSVTNLAPCERLFRIEGGPTPVRIGPGQAWPRG